jgi:cytochrome c oxidase subunit 4
VLSLLLSLQYFCYRCAVTDTSQSQGTEPITGYKGMMVQSKSQKDIGSGEKLNDE